MLMNKKTSPRMRQPRSFARALSPAAHHPRYWSIGFAAGAIGTLSGFTTAQTALLASALYAGSAQFLFYSLWATGAEVASVVLSVLLVNLRYLLMSSAMSVFFRNTRPGKKLSAGCC
ncbi:AzlC protein [Raoultella terrigena]|uniref:AzlC protein n=1 Tax=Raoultella terrigena TaxID=577 RepID=A0A4U9CXG3_RAOTE|nr:AzlC protein [Raoultella terrigena]